MSLKVSIPITDDMLRETKETFRFTLSDPGGAILRSPASATVKITDNDSWTPARRENVPCDLGLIAYQTARRERCSIDLVWKNSIR